VVPESPDAVSTTQAVSVVVVAPVVPPVEELDPVVLVDELDPVVPLTPPPLPSVARSAPVSMPNSPHLSEQPVKLKPANTHTINARISSPIRVPY